MRAMVGVGPLPSLCPRRDPGTLSLHIAVEAEGCMKTPSTWLKSLEEPRHWDISPGQPQGAHLPGI